jgi:hypothetical protein
VTVTAGTKLGPYEILSPIGAGGMGEVYRARDTRLAREVAVKVLPESLASDVERLRRFEKEARSASALNHPNIVTIHDIGSESGVSYIAMELVEGATLREQLASGPLPIKKLLQIAPQVAEGLARAHEAGIVHRDLKPENVMVKKDGLVKILDFGLAKLSSTGSGSDEASQLPTMTGTQPGVVVGTVSYMSPEQASGQTVDFRSDQFALGAMLYEMSTGKRAFQRKTAIDTLGAILNDEPEPLTTVSPQAPAPLRWIVERCLAKEPRQRFASTEDLARDLTGLRDHLTEVTSGGALSVKSSARPRVTLSVPGAIGAAVAVILATLIADRWLAPRALDSDLPYFRRLNTFGRGNLLTARFAPDGRTVVYGAAWSGAPAEIFSVRTDSGESHSIGLARADVMSVSSKGELAILVRKTSPSTPDGPGTLARVSIGGGVPRELLENVVRADWAPNGDDLAVLVQLPSGKLQLQYPIGNVLAESDNWQQIRVSPKGDLVACSEEGAVVTYDRKGKRNVVLEGWNAGELAWSTRGDELIFNGGRSDRDFAVRAVSLSGRQSRILLPNPLGLDFHDVSADGRLLMESGAGRGRIAYQTSDGIGERPLGEGPSPVPTQISNDGRLLLYSQAGEGIYLQKTDGSPSLSLGDGSARGLSADGRFVLDLKNGPPRELVLIPTGAGASKKIVVEGFEPQSAWLLPDERILVSSRDKVGSPVLFAVSAEGGKPTPVRADEYADEQPVAVSPDGYHFIYATKQGRLRVGALSGGESRIVPGAPLGLNDHLVCWSADRRSLYVWQAGEIPIRVDRLELETGRRELWKRMAPQDATGVTWVNNVVIAPDGQSYAYNYHRVFVDDLYVVEGAK